MFGKGEEGVMNTDHNDLKGLEWLNTISVAISALEVEGRRAVVLTK